MREVHMRRKKLHNLFALPMDEILLSYLAEILKKKNVY